MDPERSSFFISAFSPASSPDYSFSDQDLYFGKQQMLDTGTSWFEAEDSKDMDGRRDSVFTIPAPTTSTTTPADPLPSIIEPLLEPSAASPLETPTCITTATNPTDMLNPAPTAINTIEEPSDATSSTFSTTNHTAAFFLDPEDPVQLTTPTSAAIAPDLPTIPETSTIDDIYALPTTIAEELPSAREVCFCVSSEEWQRKKEEQLASWAVQTGQAVGGIGIGLERESCMHVLAERISGSTERRASLGLIVLEGDGL
ncbi:hypothetical protein K490DRAFT_66805 [Saccharata proteae CBS 121410]|uniref:Uncharacterized protein n=1 Tax=Saccharata proteae CBS 121410 TaxID=1314787 RepID=A0A9P4HUP6_9PEZI|nr:hypothetical protein K490DRAFT_66805 [Saccharata proteae CBS 121410]